MNETQTRVQAALAAIADAETKVTLLMDVYRNNEGQALLTEAHAALNEAWLRVNRAATYC